MPSKIFTWKELHVLSCSLSTVRPPSLLWLPGANNQTEKREEAAARITLRTKWDPASFGQGYRKAAIILLGTATWGLKGQVSGFSEGSCDSSSGCSHWGPLTLPLTCCHLDVCFFFSALFALIFIVFYMSQFLNYLVLPTFPTWKPLPHQNTPLNHSLGSWDGQIITLSHQKTGRIKQ